MELTNKLKAGSIGLKGKAGHLLILKLMVQSLEAPDCILNILGQNTNP